MATELGPDAAELTPDLVNVLEHGDPECRMQALVALAQIGAGAKSAVPTIIGLLEQESFDSVKYTAAFALGEIGDATEVEPELKKLLQAEDLGLGIWGSAQQAKNGLMYEEHPLFAGGVKGCR